MQHMCETMKKLGLNEDDSVLPAIDGCEIVSTSSEELAKLDNSDVSEPHP